MDQQDLRRSCGWQKLAAAIAASSDLEAEFAQRLFFFKTRDAAVATMQKTPGGKIARAQLIKN